ncbi:Phage Mu protein F like protein [Halpernia humi]|uniref:Phage Mu protein F like protein n=1 Tax=Halpernia humi TaxID=493375 RepID=A0A1H5ZU28_9FLAO|nr:phage minor head protein [Halpernia humi]SEG39207.1 Phage Mu protein F like protein [Halpernia humi]
MRLNSLYECDCENCRSEKINLSASSKQPEFKGVLKAAENAFKHLHEKGSYSPEDLNDKPYKKLISETNKILSSAITDNEIPPEMLAKLQNDTFIFSGLKTHAQLLEASTFLMEDGKIRGFDAFANDFNKINKNYNQNYLEAEYQFAVSSSQSAGNWAAIDPEGRYNLQYRTANDDRVRADHAALQNITLDINDSFWLSYYPPNGWRCRCLAVEVLKTKYELSDSIKANEAGDRATTKLGPDGKNRSAIFRFNPGAEQKVFPPKHPYNKLKGADDVKNIIEGKPLANVKDLSSHFENFASENPEFFARGFKEIKITRAKSVNGFTDMNGMIALKPEISELSILGINNIKAGKETTFEQERALSTLHHELWHNANKPGNLFSTKDQTKTMELANEFVARKTLPEFMKKLGGKLENTELTNSRDNTGYNKMVVNYDLLIKWSEADPKKVLKSVKTTLVEDKYSEQMKGLVSAVTENSKYDIKGKNVEALINYAKKYDNETFAELLKANEKLRLDRK